MALAVVSSENSTDAQELAGVNPEILDAIATLSNYDQNLEGLLCALGLIVTPMAGTVYGVTRCLFKTNATDVWNCVVEDFKVTLIAWATSAAVLCWIDPLTYSTLP